MQPKAPYPISDTQRSIKLTGGLIPWAAGQPVLLALENTLDQFLPVFTSEDKLRKMMAAGDVRFEKIKHIDNGTEFLESLPLLYGQGRLRIILDLDISPDGRLRFTEVLRPAVN